VNFNDEERKDLQDTVKLWAMGRDKGNQERRHPVIMMQREASGWSLPYSTTAS
jgi:hypothetical protein